MRVGLCGCDFNASVCITPEEWQTSEPVFCFDCLSNAGRLCRRQEKSGCGKFGAGDFSADGAGGDLNSRIVANALAFPGLAVGHAVNPVIVFGKPDGSVDGCAAFPESCKTDVTLSVDFGGNSARASSFSL